MSPLRGQHGVVLRAAPEGVALCAALRALDLQVTHFPTMEIRAVAPGLPSETPDLLIFISQNAVRYGAAALTAAPSARLAAIGAGSATALTALGRPVDIMPAGDGHDSEALLAAPPLRSDIAGRRIWIVRGGPGRALLGATLRERGARVHYLDVYERLLPRPAAVEIASVAALLSGDSPAWLVATSVESLANLHRLLGDRRLAYRLVTASDRVVQLAEGRDDVALVLRADAPDPASLARCLQQWAASQPDPDAP